MNFADLYKYDLGDPTGEVVENKVVFATNDQIGLFRKSTPSLEMFDHKESEAQLTLHHRYLDFKQGFRYTNVLSLDYLRYMRQF